MNGRTLIPYQGRIYITRKGIYEPVTVVSNIVSGVSKSLSDFDNTPPITFSIPHSRIKASILGGGSKINPLKAKKVMSLLKQNIQKLW
jgi:hypothetical protein